MQTGRRVQGSEVRVQEDERAPRQPTSEVALIQRLFSLIAGVPRSYPVTLTAAELEILLHTIAFSDSLPTDP